MNKISFAEEQSKLCKSVYDQFCVLIDELTELCIESEKKVEEYKNNLEKTIIPDKLIDDFIEKRRRLLISLTNKAENAKSYFAIIDYVDEALKEIESSLDLLENQCNGVFKVCQDRRPKKAFSLFNRKEPTGTNVPPPTWSHPDYIFNADALITKLNQVKDASKAVMKCNLASQYYFCLNKHNLRITKRTQ